MSAQILTIIASILAIIIGIWKRFGRIKAEKRKLAEQAKKDLENAVNNDDCSALLDAFSRVHK